MSPKPTDERQATPKQAAPGSSDTPPRPEPPQPREPGCAEQVQQTLDDALADSFPASDPVSIVTSQREEAWDEKNPP